MECDDFGETVALPWTGEPIEGLFVFTEPVGYLGEAGPDIWNVNQLAVLGQAGPDIWKVTILGRLLPYPGPGPVNRSTGLFVFPEPMNRLAILGQAGPEISNVAILGGLLPYPGPGPVNRLTWSFVPVGRLAVSVQAGLGIRNVSHSSLHGPCMRELRQFTSCDRFHRPLRTK